MPEQTEIQLPEISCDRCIAPGTCCKAFPLSNEFRFGITPDEIREWLKVENLPFEPIKRENYYCTSKDHHNIDGKSEVHWIEKWLFQCTKLGEDGKCTIYDSRPDLCRKYTAGCDAMCVHMRLPDGNPIIPQLPKIEEVIR